MTLKKYKIDSILGAFDHETKTNLLAKITEELEMSDRHFGRYRRATTEDSLKLKKYQLEVIAKILKVKTINLIHKPQVVENGSEL